MDGKLEFLKELEPAFAVLKVGARILPNTTLAQIALEEGIIGSESELVKPVFYVASEVQDWLEDMLRAEAEGYPRWNLM